MCRVEAGNIVSKNQQCYHVEWFITSTIQSDVTIRIENDRVVQVESGRSAEAIDLGHVALVSGLVNAHTHLEFSNLEKPIPSRGLFTDWIRGVISQRLTDPSGTGRAIKEGLEECVRAGTTLVGEIASQNWTEHDYRSSKIDLVAFQEVLGLLPPRVALQKEILSAFAKTPHSAFQNGLSPHAPYSTHLQLVRHAVELAQEHRLPVAMHLAETKAEVEFLATQRGEFYDFLSGMGLWNDDPDRFGTSPLDYLQILSNAPRVLVIHGNYLNDDELRFLARHPHMTLVYCPRTHAAFGHAEHPWRRATELGVRVAIGTDSRASNPNLSLFEELQFLASQSPDVSHLELLTMGSTNGRQAIVGELSECASFTLIRPRADEQLSDPETNLFTSTNSVAGTMIRGTWVWHDQELDRLISV